MPNFTSIKKGRVILYQKIPHVVLEALHRTQGRQAGFIQTTLRNLKSGTSTTTKFRSTDNIKFCHTKTYKMEFLYKEKKGYHFMHVENFESIILSNHLVENQKKFLSINSIYEILFVDDRAIQIQLPSSIKMKVIEAPEAIKGDTASSTQKPVKLESGIIVYVPLFIKNQETIRINTNDCSYLGRA